MNNIEKIKAYHEVESFLDNDQKKILIEMLKIKFTNLNDLVIFEIIAFITSSSPIFASKPTVTVDSPEGNPIEKTP